MVDDRLRELARSAREGDGEAMVHWLVSRARAGLLDLDRLELAACLGSEPARAAWHTCSARELRAHDKVWEVFRHFPPELAQRAALALVWHALPRYEMCAPDGRAREIVGDCQRLLADPAGRKRVEQHRTIEDRPLLHPCKDPRFTGGHIKTPDERDSFELGLVVLLQAMLVPGVAASTPSRLQAYLLAGSADQVRDGLAMELLGLHSEEERRVLEAHHGDPVVLRLWKRRRAGELDDERLLWAARLDHRPAALLLGAGAPRPASRLEAWWSSLLPLGRKACVLALALASRSSRELQEALMTWARLPGNEGAEAVLTAWSAPSKHDSGRLDDLLPLVTREQGWEAATWSWLAREAEVQVGNYEGADLEPWGDPRATVEAGLRCSIGRALLRTLGIIEASAAR